LLKYYQQVKVYIFKVHVSSIQNMNIYNLDNSIS
jgi:hypothetical protein